MAGFYLTHCVWQNSHRKCEHSGQFVIYVVIPEDTRLPWMSIHKQQVQIQTTAFGADVEGISRAILAWFERDVTVLEGKNGRRLLCFRLRDGVLLWKEVDRCFGVNFRTWKDVMWCLYERFGFTIFKKKHKIDMQNNFLFRAKSSPEEGLTQFLGVLNSWSHAQDRRA